MAKTLKQLQQIFGRRHVTKEKGDDGFVVNLGQQIMSISNDFDEWRKTIFAPFVEDTDYYFWIGYGDDMPNAVTIKNVAMFDNEKIVEWLEEYAGSYE